MYAERAMSEEELIFSSVTTISSLVQCKHCSNSYNNKFRYCPFCGEQVEKSPEVKNLLCPHCNVVMEKVMEIASIIDVCPNCEGIYCENDGLEEITRERDIYKMDDIPRRFVRKRPPDDIKYIKCPECNTVMNRTNFGGISNIIVDVCYNHGVWLDSGELEEIRSFIANGGINKAQNKDIIKNRIAIEKNASNVNDVRLLLRVINKFNIKRITLNGF